LESQGTRAAKWWQAFQKAIDLSQSRYPEALFGLASLLSNNQLLRGRTPWQLLVRPIPAGAMGLNRVETAQKIAEETRKRNPDYPQLYLLLANIHIRKRGAIEGS